MTILTGDISESQFIELVNRALEQAHEEGFSFYDVSMDRPPIEDAPLNGIMQYRDGDRMTITIKMRRTGTTT